MPRPQLYDPLEMVYYRMTKYTATQEPDIANLLRHAIYDDSRGAYKYECPNGPLPGRGTDLAADNDNDTVPDACDTCDMRDDWDGDGVPDCQAFPGAVVDRCPCDPGEVDPWTADSIADPFHRPSPPILNAKSDGDGICGLGCLGVSMRTMTSSPLDNCPSVWNRDQKNTNLASERKQNAEILGDDCDPVPLGDFAPRYTTQKNAAISSDTLAGIDVTPLAARSRGPEHRALLPAGAPYPVEVPETHYRACVDALHLGVDCKAERVISEDWIRDRRFGGYLARGQEAPGNPWHRVTISPWDALGQRLDGQEGPRFYQDGNRWSVDVDWRHDVAEWAQRWGGEYAATASSTANVLSRGASARFWVHANTSVGMGGAQSEIGKHELLLLSGVLPGTTVTEMANVFNPVTLQATRAGYNATALNPFARYRDCWICEALHPRPHNEGDPAPSARLRELTERGNVLPIGTLPPVHAGDAPRLAVLSERGIEELADLASLETGNGLVWASQEEATAYEGVGTQMPAAVAFRADGTAIVDGLFHDGGLPVTARKAAASLVNGDVVLGPVQNLALRFATTPLAASSAGPNQDKGAPTATTSPRTPTPRAAFAPVYSRAHGLAFVVGGTDAKGQALPEIWQQELSTAAWSRVAVPGLGKVLAATYQASEGALWLLDETSGKSKRARLWRVDVRAGTARTLGTWVRRGGTTQQWLMADLDGSVLLVATTATSHTVTRLRLEAKGLRYETTSGTFGLAMAPSRDANGYSFVKAPQKGEGLSVVRVPSLALHGDSGSCVASAL